MGIIGIQKDVDENLLVDLDDEIKEATTKKAANEPEFFNTKQLFTDNYWKKLVFNKEAQSKRRDLLVERIRDIQKIAQDTPLGNSRPGDENMLMVKHSGMAGKTKIVGSTVFIF